MTEMQQCAMAGLLRRVSGVADLRSRAMRLALKLEGGQFYSLTARWIMEKRYGILIGHYSYGECFLPGAFPAGVSIGRYASIGPDVRIFLRNHPMDWLSMHPFFYNQWLGFVASDTISTSTLSIGHDAWIGARSIILPGCSQIGMGAVVGAGSVVTRNVPEFAIVAGNPARIIRMRFPEEICQKIKESRWWERSADECISHMIHMTVPLGENYLNHPLLSRHDAQKSPS